MASGGKISHAALCPHSTFGTVNVGSVEVVTNAP